MKNNSNIYDLEALEDIEFPDYPLTEDATPHPSSPFELPCSCVEDLIDYPSLESDFPSDTHFEALAALHEAESEQRRDFDRQGVVIRYRVRESVPIFRSSSVPAGASAHVFILSFRWS